jgi:hypothetical protein
LNFGWFYYFFNLITPNWFFIRPKIFFSFFA